MTRRLEVALRSHERSRASARYAHAEATQRSDWLRGRIADAEQDATSIEDVAGDKFQATLTLSDKPVTMTDRRAAGEVLLRHLLREGAQHFNTLAIPHEVGLLSGFVMKAGIRRHKGELQVEVGLTGRRFYSRAEFFPLSEETDPLGFVRRFEAILKQIPQAATSARAELARLEADLPRLERQMTPTPFARQDRLDVAKRRLMQLDTALQAEEAARTATPATSPAAVAEDAQATAPKSAAKFSVRASSFGDSDPGASRQAADVAGIIEALRQTATEILPPEVRVQVVERLGLSASCGRACRRRRKHVVHFLRICGRRGNVDCWRSVAQ